MAFCNALSVNVLRRRSPGGVKTASGRAAGDEEEM